MSLRMYAKDLPLEITPAAFLTDLISPGGRRMSMSWRSLTRTTVRLKFSGSSVGTAMTYSKSIQWLIQCGCWSTVSQKKNYSCRYFLDLFAGNFFKSNEYKVI